MSLYTILVIFGSATIFAWLGYLTFKIFSIASQFSTDVRATQSKAEKQERESEQRDQMLAEDQNRLFQELNALRQDLHHLHDGLVSLQPERADPKSHQEIREERHARNPRNDIYSEREASLDVERQLVADYNALASEFSGIRRDKFLQSHNPVIVAFEHGRFVEQESGQFWLIEDERGESSLVIPSGKVARDWEKLYRSMGGLTAKQTFEEVFDLEDGSSLLITNAAKAETLRVGGRLVEMGRMKGL